MEYEQEPKKRKMSALSVVLLALGMLLFVTAALAPFVVRATSFGIVSGFVSADGAKPGCAAESDLAQTNQCADWQAPELIGKIGLLSVALVLLVGLGLNYYATSRLKSDGQWFAQVRFVVSLGIAALTVLVYASMRAHSQHNGSSNFGFFAVHLVNGTYVPSGTYRFGYGISPLMYTLLATAFLVPAYMSWYRFVYSSRYVGGQKKKELFQ